MDEELLMDFHDEVKQTYDIVCDLIKHNPRIVDPVEVCDELIEKLVKSLRSVRQLREKCQQE